VYYIVYMSEEKDTDVVAQQPNLFVPLVGEAYSVLRQAMHNSDVKLAVSTAKDILDYAGQKKETAKTEHPVIIKDAQVVNIMQVLKEVFE
jgi:hypothetical protein